MPTVYNQLGRANLEGMPICCENHGFLWKKQGRSVHTYNNYDTYMTFWEFNIAMKYHGVFIRESSIHGLVSTSQTVSRYREGRC